MPCEFPLKAYRTEELSPSGKRLITFNPLRAVNSIAPMEFPCNNCMGCRLERSRQWAVRMMHEAKFYDQNCFITLTYSNETVPTDFSLNLRHWQLFMKRLRQSCPQRLRFFACGEYGDENLRPHYHAIIFNHDFHDKKLHSYNKQKQPIYTSDTLSKIWQMGHVTTQDVTFKSAAYVARYVTKKINGTLAADYYFRRSPVDGNPYQVKPEFAVMSRRPGLGSAYAEKFKSDFYPSGYIVVDGVKQSPPSFYKKKLSEEEQATLRKNYVRKPRSERTMERKMARSAVLHARIKNLKRNL